MASWAMIPACSMMVLTACSRQEYFSNKAGAGQMLSSSAEAFNDARLASLIEAASNIQAPSTGQSAPQSQGEPKQSEPQAALRRIDNAVIKFPTSAGTDAVAQNQIRDKRNEVQGLLLSASENRCNDYKVGLRRSSSRFGFYSGAISTTLGTVGALVTNGAAQIFAGLSGLSSGIGAQYQQDYFSSLTTSVIIPGIDQQRSSILANIQQRRCLGVSSYSLSMAVVDALRYHGACSMDVGIAAAGQAVALNAPRPIGLLSARDTVAAGNSLQATLGDPKSTSIAEPKAFSGITPSLGVEQPILICATLDANGLPLSVGTTPAGRISGAKPPAPEPPSPEARGQTRQRQPGGATPSPPPSSYPGALQLYVR